MCRFIPALSVTGFVQSPGLSKTEGNRYHVDEFR
jgi:hypothetical protein